MKKIILLGATGSIGEQTLNVIKNFPNDFMLIGISVGYNIEKMEKILNEFNTIKYVCCELDYKNEKYEVFKSKDGIHQLIKKEADIIVNAISGFAGVEPSFWTLEANKKLCLANKETFVVAGELIKNKMNNIIPIDSEHSAIFQCLQGENKKEIKRIILTASGGSFRDLTRDELENVSVNDALNHPNWNMGKFITIDSATMFNKALEIIEAHYLFDLDYDKIDVIMHKESIIHSLVEFNDSSIKAQLSTPTMEIPILYALSYPNRLNYNINNNLADWKNLSFKEIDTKRFPAIKIAYEVGKKKGTYPCVLNASKEASCELFLNNQIKFSQIEDIVIESLKNHQNINTPTLSDLIEVDHHVREEIFKKYRR